MTNITLLWWHWAVVGLGLIGLELVVPGVFLLGSGLACMGVALSLVASPTLDFSTQMIIFCVLACICTFFIKKFWYKKSHDVNLLNNKRAAFIGKSFRLEEPIVNGLGRLKINDSLWMIKGEDAPIHALVTVVGFEDTTLLVKLTPL